VVTEKSDNEGRKRVIIVERTERARVGGGRKKERK